MKTNRTVQRAIQMLSYTAAHPEGVSLDEYCEQLALPKTSAYDILVTLVQEGMLSIKPSQKQLYQIGIFAYRIGMSYPDANDALKLIAAELTIIPSSPLPRSAAQHLCTAHLLGKRFWHFCQKTSLRRFWKT